MFETLPAILQVKFNLIWLPKYHLMELCLISFLPFITSRYIKSPYQNIVSMKFVFWVLYSNPSPQSTITQATKIHLVVMYLSSFFPFITSNKFKMPTKVPSHGIVFEWSPSLLRLQLHLIPLRRLYLIELCLSSFFPFLTSRQIYSLYQNTTSMNYVCFFLPFFSYRHI